MLSLKQWPLWHVTCWKGIRWPEVTPFPFSSLPRSHFSSRPGWRHPPPAGVGWVGSRQAPRRHPDPLGQCFLWEDYQHAGVNAVCLVVPKILQDWLYYALGNIERLVGSH